MKLKNKFLFLLIALTPLLLGVGGSGIDFSRVGDLGGFQGTNTASTPSFTPASGAFGTISANSIFSYRLGDRLYATGGWTNGTTAGGTAALALPAGYVIDSAKMPTVGTIVGYVVGGTDTNAIASGNRLGVIFYDGSDTGNLYFAFELDGSGNLNKNVGSAFAVTGKKVRIVIDVGIPISGWAAGGGGTSNGVISNSTDQRIERLKVAGNCSSSPCTITSQSGAFSSVTRNSTGDYTANITSGFFSAAPTCSLVPIKVGATVISSVAAAITTTAFAFRIHDVSINFADAGFDIICMGPK